MKEGNTRIEKFNTKLYDNLRYRAVNYVPPFIGNFLLIVRIKVSFISIVSGTQKVIDARNTIRT